jgi:hypothetical protein
MEIEVGDLVRGRPFGQSRRATGTVIRIVDDWIVYVETLPNRNDHTRTVLIDIDNVESL